MTNPPEIKLRDMFPDPHFKQVEEHFSASTAAQRAEGRKKLIAAIGRVKVFYVLCFTNRCGSNHLGECIASDGRVGRAHEGLNFEAVINNSVRLGFNSFDEYLAWLIKRHTGSAGVFGVKAGAGQLLGLHHRGILHLVGAKLRLIYSFRREVLEQAVSHFIAERTRQWTSVQTKLDTDIVYEPNEILGTVHAICKQNATFAMLFELWGVEPARIPYDKMLTEPEKIVKRVGRHLGVANLQIASDKVKLSKQASAINAELLAHLQRDFALAMPAAPRQDPSQDAAAL